LLLQVEMLERDWHRKLHKEDKIVHFPPDLLMVHRVALLLRGLSIGLRQNSSMAESWRPHAVRAVEAASPARE
jgi:aarF domain-containing kinase